MANFPHLKDSAFPELGTVNVYKYDNEFDYNRYSKEKAAAKICRVPWDSRYRNVVKFENDAARDAYFNALPAQSADEFLSEFKVLPLTTYRVPLPADVAMQYNYLVLDNPPITSATDLVEGETLNGARKLFYFIKGATYLASNCTDLTLELDFWTTFINSITFKNVMLERGHAPVAATTVEQYLSNPLENSDFLLAPDINYGSAENVASNNNIFFNTDAQYCCIVTSADIYGNWTQAAPAISSANIQGAPSMRVVAIEASEFNQFFLTAARELPQFLPTVAGVFFISKNLVTVNNRVQFCGFSVGSVYTKQNNIKLPRLTKKNFNYDAKYADLAKLYTAPYAELEVVSADGASFTLRIENTNNALELSATVNMIFPAINVDTFINGANGQTVTDVTFKNLTNHAFAGSGRWQQYLRAFNIPVFAITADAGVMNEVQTRFNREQSKTAYTNAYNSAATSAKAGLDSANAGAATSEQNASLQASANVAITTQSSSTSTTDTKYSNLLNVALQRWNAGYSRATALADNDAAQESSGVSMAGTAISGIANAVGGAIGGFAAGGPAGAAIGGISGAAGALCAGATTAANTAISVGLTTTKTEAGIANTQNTLEETNQSNLDRNGLQVKLNNANTATQNKASLGMTANSANTTRANAKRSYDASINSAQLTRSTSQAAISNQLKQAELAAPLRYGNVSNVESAATRPVGYSFNVLTQNKSNIARAGDAMLRYGYYFNGAWQISDLNVMPHFTYWQCSDVWADGAQPVFANALNVIEDVMRAGVTVWRKPSEIGKVGIYGNR